MKITVYGDSICKGVLFDAGRYRRNGSWERSLARELGCEIRNRSHFGCTIRKALPLLRKEMETPGGEGDLVLLELGGNDCDYDWAAISADPSGRYRCNTPPELFAADYREAICRIRESGRTPIAASLPPIHAERYLSFICRNGLSRENILRWLGEIDAIFRWQKTYSDLVVQLAREEQVELADLRGVFPRERNALERFLCQDGIHPSLMGQERIYEVLRAKAAALL